MSEGFGVPTAVALGVGGIVGGGIYAAIGIVVMAGGVLTWFSFTLASVVVLCCAYSYIKLNALLDTEGGSVTLIEELTDQRTLAAVVGWTLVVGYIGTMAMYAYAFGAYGQMLVGVEYLWGLPFRPFLSVAIVAVFVALNMAGAHITGATERYLVFVQAGIIALFGLIALWFGLEQGSLRFGLSEFGMSPIIAASVGFVSFEGWQLLLYDAEQFENPQETLAKGVFISIPIAGLIYILVGFVITSLLPVAVVTAQPEAALLYAGLRISPWLALAIGLAGLVSTASAINSTLFSESIFAKNLIADDILPAEMGDADQDDPPARTVLVIGVLTAAFTVLGSLEAVVEFASLSFIVVFGIVNGLAIAHHDPDTMSRLPPLFGAIGSAGFFVMLLWFLYNRLPHVFTLVIAIAIVVFTLEALYFERDTIRDGVETLEGEH